MQLKRADDVRWTRFARTAAVAVAACLAAGCGGSPAKHAGGGSGGSHTSASGQRIRLTEADLPDALNPGVWPGLQVYRSGTVYDAYTARMPVPYQHLPGGPYDASDVCASILGDALTAQNATLGDVVVEVFGPDGSLAAETGGDGRCKNS